MESESFTKYTSGFSLQDQDYRRWEHLYHIIPIQSSIRISDLAIFSIEDEL